MLLLLTLLTPLGGCRSADTAEDTAPPEPVPLVDAEVWSALPLADDPLPTHQPAEVSCVEQSWFPEYTGLEIDTTGCNYLSLTQPLLLEVSAGEPLSLLAWHQTLISDEDTGLDTAEQGAIYGHMALLIDGIIAWEIEVPIPASAGLYEITVDAPADAPRGAPVVLHLHNHGYNTWQFAEATVLR